MLIDLIKKAIEAPTFALHGPRKIVQGLYHELEELPGDVDIIKTLGYGKQKVTRLMNVYYNAEEVAAAKAKLTERKGNPHSSVSVLMRNQSKDSRSQGWCIQNIVVSTDRWGNATADVFYRSTELIQKFGADFTLINRVFRDLEVEPYKIRMYFANAYVSAVFFPLLFRTYDGIELLRFAEEKDPEFWFLAAKTVSRYLDPNNRYSYKAQVRQWNFAQELDRKPFDKYLMKKIPEYHKEHLP